MSSSPFFDNEKLRKLFFERFQRMCHSFYDGYSTLFENQQSIEDKFWPSAVMIAGLRDANVSVLTQDPLVNDSLDMFIEATQGVIKNRNKFFTQIWLPYVTQQIDDLNSADPELIAAYCNESDIPVIAPEPEEIPSSQPLDHVHPELADLEQKVSTGLYSFDECPKHKTYELGGFKSERCNMWCRECSELVCAYCHCRDRNNKSHSVYHYSETCVVPSVAEYLRYRMIENAQLYGSDFDEAEEKDEASTVFAPIDLETNERKSESKIETKKRKLF
jgi:hypothetical protein